MDISFWRKVWICHSREAVNSASKNAWAQQYTALIQLIFPHRTRKRYIIPAAINIQGIQNMVGRSSVKIRNILCTTRKAALLTQKRQIFRDYEEKSVNKIFYDNDRRKTGMKSAFRLCFIYNSYKIACQERAGNPPVFLTFFIIPVSVPHT